MCVKTHVCRRSANMVTQNCRPCYNWILEHRRARRRPAAASRGSLLKRRAFVESTHMCVAETRQPGSATAEACCVGCLVVTCAAPGACPAWMIKRTHASENPAPRTADPANWSLEHTHLLGRSTKARRGALSKRPACIGMTHICVAETRQYGSVTVEAFCIGRLTAHAPASGAVHA